MKRISLALSGMFFILIVLQSQSVVGTWTFNNGNFPLTLLLLDNGNGEFQGVPIKFKTLGGKLNIDDGVQPVSYNYSVTQTSLTLSGGGLQVPVTFTRQGSAGENGAVQNQQAALINNGTPENSITSQGGKITGMAGNNPNQQKGGSDLTGIWEGQQGKIVFYPDGTLLYNGTSYQYSSSGNMISITGNDGSITFNYTLASNQLTLSQNANSASYSRTSSLQPDRVDPQLAGKWCIVSSNYNSYSGGGSSSEECITLNADGSYVYFYSASRSAYAAGQTAYGSTANQNSDHGMWKTDGITLVSVSQTTGKTSRYTLVKENAPNGDATIVIGGRKFVTAYNRPGW